MVTQNQKVRFKFKAHNKDGNEYIIIKLYVSGIIKAETRSSLSPEELQDTLNELVSKYVK